MNAVLAAMTVMWMQTVLIMLADIIAPVRKDILEMDARVQVNWLYRIITTDNWSILNILKSSVLEIDFEINISDKKSRRFDLSEVISSV